MLIRNTLPMALPIPKGFNIATGQPMTYEELSDRSNLQLRERIKHGAGEVGGLKPLDPTEKKRLRAYKASMWAETSPRWNGKDFPFAAAGAEGSVYDIEPDVARFLQWAYNKGNSLLCNAPGDKILDERGPFPEVLPVRVTVDDPMKFTSEAFLEYGKDGKLVRSSVGQLPPRAERTIDVGKQARVPA